MEQNNNEAEKPEKPSCCTRFRTSMKNAGHFIYNSETKEVLGRTGISWLKVLSFYFAFYAILAGFWAVCLVCFIRTLDYKVPTMQKMYSMMKDNPGMNFEPYFVGKTSTLVSFDQTNVTTYSKYVDELNSVYEIYSNMSIHPQLFKGCSANDGANADKACMFQMTSFGANCTPENNFGYPDGKPCIMLRINRVFLWQPNDVTLGMYPGSEKAVEFLGLPNHTKTSMDPDYIAVSCQGENDGDIDNIKMVTFFPSAGYPTYFFPYYNQLNYTSPIVMAQFDVVRGRVSMIMCKVWTRDIIHDANDLQASVHFELMVSEEHK